DHFVEKPCAHPADTTEIKIKSSYRLTPMADPSSEQRQLQPPELSQLVSQAQQALGEIKSFRGQAETHLKQAEISRKNADSEALLAFNAKKACEEHATAI